MIKLKDILEGKYNPYKAKKLTFVTFGGLSATKQLGYKKSDTFHAPPAKKGIYAFVWPYIEKFLLGGDLADPKQRGKGQRQRATYVRDKDGNIVTTGHPDFEKKWMQHPSFTRQVEPKGDDLEVPQFTAVLYKHANRKKFQYGGDIWHHLTDVPEWTVINRRGDWVKTDMNTFIEAFKKAIREVDFDNYSMDHLEVFIEDKI